MMVNSMVHKGNLWLIHAMLLFSSGDFFRFFLRWDPTPTTSPRIRKPTISNEESVMLTSVAARASVNQAEYLENRREMQMLGQDPFSL